MNKLEQTIISIILSKVLFFGPGFSFIIDKASTSSFIAIIIGYLLGGIIIYLFMKKELNNTSSKILIYIISIIVLLISILAFTLETTSFYLNNTPPLIIALVLVFVCLYASLKGINTWVRLSESLIIYSILL